MFGSLGSLVWNNMDSDRVGKTEKLYYCGPARARVCADVRGSWYHWRPCLCQGSGPLPGTMLASENQAVTAAMTIWMACAATQVMVTSEPRLLIWTMCRIMVLPQPESMLVSVAHNATKGHMDAHGLDCNLWPCWSEWFTLLYGIAWGAAMCRVLGSVTAVVCIDGHSSCNNRGA